MRRKPRSRKLAACSSVASSTRLMRIPMVSVCSPVVQGCCRRCADRSHARMSTTTRFDVRLTDDQIEQFHTEGYTWVPRLTTDEELEWLAPIYDGLFAEKRGAFKGGYFDLARPYEAEGEDLVPQVLAPEYQHPELRDTNIFRNAMAIGAQLLGLPECDLKAWSHMILKPPHVGGPLPWHQDEAYWETAFAYRALGVWVPL